MKLSDFCSSRETNKRDGLAGAASYVPLCVEHVVQSQLQPVAWKIIVGVVSFWRCHKYLLTIKETGFGEFH